jgi:hypothetical protein
MAAEPVGIGSRPARLAYANGPTVGEQPARHSKRFARRGIADTQTPIVSDQNYNAVVRPDGLGSPKYTSRYKRLHERLRTCLIRRAAPSQRDRTSILTVGYRKENPPFATGVSLGRRLQTKLIRGASLYRNSHTLFEKQT